MFINFVFIIRFLCFNNQDVKKFKENGRDWIRCAKFKKYTTFTIFQLGEVIQTGGRDYSWGSQNQDWEQENHVQHEYNPEKHEEPPRWDEEEETQNHFEENPQNWDESQDIPQQLWDESTPDKGWNESPEKDGSRQDWSKYSGPETNPGLSYTFSPILHGPKWVPTKVRENFLIC